MNCDPRVSWDNCPEQWIMPLRVFYTALALFATSNFFTAGGYCIITLRLQGFSFRTLPRHLLILQIFIASIILSYALAISVNNGTLKKGVWQEILFGLPMFMTIYSFGTLVVTMKYLYGARLDELIASNQNIASVYIHAYKVSLSFGIPMMAALISSVIILSKYPQHSQWAYLIQSITCAIVGGGILITLFSIRNLIKKIFKHVPRTLTCFKVIPIMMILWILASIIYAASYNHILPFNGKNNTIGSIAGWIILNTIYQVCLAFSFTFLSKMLASETFTAKGFQALRPSAQVKIKRQGVKRQETVSKIETDGISAKKQHNHKKKKELEEPHACPYDGCKLENIDVVFARELAKPFWVNKPKSFRDLFVYPHPSNDIEIRFQLNVIYFYIPLVYGYISRTLCGPRFDPITWALVYGICPFFTPVYVAGPPKRFAQASVSVFVIISVVLLGCGYKLEGLYLLGIAVPLLFTQAVHGLCPGCFIFALLTLAKLIPEAVRLKSNNEFSLDKSKSIVAANVVADTPTPPPTTTIEIVITESSPVASASVFSDQTETRSDVSMGSRNSSESML